MDFAVRDDLPSIAANPAATGFGAIFVQVASSRHRTTSSADFGEKLSILR